MKSTGSATWNYKQLGFAFEKGHIVKVYGDPAESLKLVLDELEKRKTATRRGVETRARRRESQINAVVAALLKGEQIGPRQKCACCNKRLEDQTSIERGIGPECYEEITQAVERQRARQANPSTVYD